MRADAPSEVTATGHEVGPTSTEHSPRLTTGRRLVRALDAWLRRREGIFEFTDDPDCLIRLSLGRAEFGAELSDGTCVKTGDPVLDLHLWNEHLIPAGRDGADMAWGTATLRRGIHSFALLMRWLENDQGPEINAIQVIHGKTIFMPRRGARQLNHMMRRVGLQPVDRPSAPRLGRRAHEFLENLLLHMLVWTFNPNGLGRTKLLRERHDFWMSREMLRKQYTTDADR
jgi:hypothetical protein